MLPMFPHTSSFARMPCSAAMGASSLDGTLRDALLPDKLGDRIGASVQRQRPMQLHTRRMRASTRGKRMLIAGVSVAGANAAGLTVPSKELREGLRIARWNQVQIGDGP
jgi:hypothetical protein